MCSIRMYNNNYYYYYYYYCLYYHSLCWCSFCASAGRKPCTYNVSHSSQSFCSYTEHLSKDSYRSQHADLLNLRHSSSLSDTFLMFSTIPFFTVPSAPTTTGITTVFICHIIITIIIIIIIIIIMQYYA